MNINIQVNPAIQTGKYNVNAANIKQKTQVFKAEFISIFDEKFFSYNNSALYKEASEIECTTGRGVIKIVLENVLNNTLSSVPVIGPFAAAILTQIPSQIYEYYEGRNIAKDAAEVNNICIKMGEEAIFRTIEETAHEITRIFEEQIASVKTPNDSKILARFAVEKIFAYSEMSRIEFNHEELILALLAREIHSVIDRIQSLLSLKDKVETTTGVVRSPEDFFSKVGLRVEGDTGSYTYKILSSIDPICGYRGPVFTWNANEKTFVSSKIDELFIKTNLSSSYIPYQRLVRQHEIDNYLNQLISKSAPKAFKDFFKDENHLNEEVIPVFRNVRLVKNISGGDLSECDLSRIVLSSMEAVACSFSHSRMVAATFSDVDMTNSNLKGADIRWGRLHNVSLKEKTNLVQTDFSYALLDKETDLTNNLSFASAIKNSSHILTSRIQFTLLKQLQEQEEKARRKEARLEVVAEELRIIQIAAELQAGNRKANKQELYFFNVRNRVPDFTGREGPLSRINAHFIGMQSKCAIAVIAAGGGVGKTQAALEYVARNKGVYQDRVFWVSAENRGSVADSFRNFAEKLYIPTEKRTDEEILKDIKRRLRTLDSTLFIFDNVEDRSFLKDYLPEPSTHHHVLITTRDSSIWPSNYHIEQLKSFSEEEAIEYIQKNVSWAEMSEMKELANLFGNHPLGLSQGTAYIKENDLQIPEYIDYYKEYKAQMLQEDIANDPHMSGVYTTLSMAVDSLSSKYGKAVELLKLCAYLHADAIPEAIFYSLFESESERLKAIASLKTVSLISVAQGEDSRRVLYIHRLLQEVIKIKVADEDVRLLLKVMELTREQMPNDEDVLVRLTNKSMLQHAITVLANYEIITKQPLELRIKETLDNTAIHLFFVCGDLYQTIVLNDKAMEMYLQLLAIVSSSGWDNSFVAIVLIRIAGVYAKQGNYPEAFKAFEEALRIRKAILGPDHKDVATALNNMANEYQKQGNYAKALEGYEEALRITKITLDSDHPKLAIILCGIASVYENQGDYVKALKYYEEALLIEKEKVGPDYAGVATTINNIANVYSKQGNYTKSLEEHEEALRIRKKSLGSDHPIVADSLHNIANVYSKQGNYAKALEGYEEALQIKKAAFGPDHPDVADILTNRSTVYNDQGYHEKALDSLEEAVRIKTAILGPDHPDLLAILHNKAILCYNQGDYAEALKEFEEALRIGKATLDPDHLQVATSLNGISDVYIAQGNYTKALEGYEEALRIRKTTLGSDHPIVATTLDNIALLYYGQGNYAKALEGFEEILRIQKATLGPDHPDVADTLDNIANMYANQNDYIKALERFEEALPIKKAILGLHHPDVASFLNIIARAYYNQGNYEKALERQEEALQIKKIILGSDHSDVAAALNNIVLLYHEQGNCEKALEGFKEILRIEKITLGSDHPDVATTLNNIANMYFSQGNYTKALECYEETLQIRIGIHGYEHESVGEVLYNIGSTSINMENYDLALKKYEEALEIYTIAYGPDHSETIELSNTIINLKESMGIQELEELNKNLKSSQNVASTKSSSHQSIDDPETQNQAIEETNILNKQALQFRTQEKYDKALEIYEKILQLRSAKFPYDHWSIASTLYDIATLYQAQEKFDQALEKYTDILQRKKAKLGVDHPDIAEVLRNIIAMEDNLDIAPDARISVVEMKQMKLMSDKKKNVTPLNNKKKCVVS